MPFSEIVATKVLFQKCSIDNVLLQSSYVLQVKAVKRRKKKKFSFNVGETGRKFCFHLSSLSNRFAWFVEHITTRRIFTKSKWRKRRTWGTREDSSSYLSWASTLFANVYLFSKSDTKVTWRSYWLGMSGFKYFAVICTFHSCHQNKIFPRSFKENNKISVTYSVSNWKRYQQKLGIGSVLFQFIYKYK